MKIVQSLVLALSIFFAAGTCYAAMTDDQVIQYVKQATQQGKDQKQIGKELLARGVTEAQVNRIRIKLEQAEEKVDDTSDAYKRQMNVIRKGEETPDNISEIANEATERSTATFGRQIFRSPALTFEPNENVATPEDYRLGPGDEVVIDIWGNNEDRIRQTISPEGRIFVSQIGPIYLNGLTIKEANKLIKEKMSTKYSDVAESGSDISLTLGQMRTIQVDIMGEVATPGTYRLSPFSTLFHALYRAGGPSNKGTLREIEVMRNGRKIASIDIYQYLFEGKKSADIRLQEGDVIVIPSYDRIVTVAGEVKRPMQYEMKRGETLADLIKFAGGFTSNAFTERINIDRVTNGAHTMATVEQPEYTMTRLDDGDVVTIGSAVNRYDNRVEVRGSVFQPGNYALSPEMKNITDLINVASGLKEDAYLTRAQLFREKDDLSIEVISIDLGAVLGGTQKNIELKPNDVLVISSIHELEPKGNVTIAGEIRRPASYPYADNMTVEDLVLEAGGLLEGASSARISVSRRIIDPGATEITASIATIYNLTIENGLVVDKDKNFKLMPYDIVDIRRSPGYVPQRRVSIGGEVPFTGTYTLDKRSERLSDLVRRAGGVSKYAYVRGSHLTRRLSEDEIAARQEAILLARQSAGDDSISIGKLNISTTYTVGIDLEKALANPGSLEDLVLQEGDHLFIPEMVNTVKVSGDVLFPNTVIYTPGKKLKYYIEQSGGWGSKANKGKVFVVYMNGTVSKGKKSPIEPGCRIIVPSKGDKKGVSLAEWLAITTSASSIGTAAAAITNLISK